MTDLVHSADLFCGAGGTSAGLIDACADLGLELSLVAINHWEIAIETHLLNNPGVQHYCSNLEDIDPRLVVPGGTLRLLVASPECTHFSNARGGEPVTNQNRASIKYVLRWLSALDVRDVLIENVPEFRHWGPLHRKGPLSGRPIQNRKGQFFNRFLSKLRAMGYTVEHRILCAADYGDATSRRRLFIRARKGGAVTWPEPSHSPKSKTLALFGELRPYRTARDILDLDRKGESIFNRKKPLSPNTMRRIMAGLRKFSGLPFMLGQQSSAAPRSVDDPVPTVAGAGAISVIQPFILPNEGVHRGNAARSLDDPLPTITAERGAGHLVEPFIVGAGGPDLPAASIDEPLGTVLARNNRAVVQPFIVGAGGPSGAAKPQSVDQPLGTVLAEDRRAIVQPFLVGSGGPKGSGAPNSVDEPLGSVLGTNHHAVAQPYLVAIGQTGGNGDRTRSADQPVPTIVSKAELALAQPFIVKMYGTSDAAPVDDPLPTVTGGNHLYVADPYLVEYHGGEGGNERVKSVDDPLPTQTVENRFGLAQPYLLAIRGGDDSYMRGASVDEPLQTVTGAAPFALVEPQFKDFIVQMEHSSEKSGDDRRVYGTERPLPTITSKAHFGLVELQPFLVKYYGQGAVADVDDPLPTVTSIEKFGLAVPVQGGYAIIDVLFRMLDVDELARAHSMDDYKFQGTKKDVVKQIGNSVPRRLAAALCRAALAK